MDVFVNVFAASLAVWTAFVLYALHLWRRLRALQQKVESLQRRDAPPTTPASTEKQNVGK